MTLFIGPVGSAGGPSIKNSITLKYLFDDPAGVRVLNTEKCSRVRQALDALRFACSKDGQAIVAVSRTGRKVLYPIAARKGGRGDRLALICIGGTVAEEASGNPRFMRALSRASMVAVETRGVAQKLEALGVPRPYVFPNFVEHLAACQPLVSFSEPTVRFVFLSSVRNVKGIATMLLAFRKALARGANASLDMYGPMRTDFDRGLFDGLGSRGEPIAYCGPVNHDAVRETLAGYHCFVFPTEYKLEGFPAVLAEAMASGLPIIASDIAYNAEIVSNERGGLLFPAGDDEALAACICRLCEHRETLKRMSQVNAAEASRFDAETVIASFKSELIERGWSL